MDREFDARTLNYNSKSNAMKTLKTLVILFMTTALMIGCSKDDDGSKKASLVGTWNLVEQSLNGISHELNECEEKTLFIFTEEQVTSKTYEGELCEIEVVDVYSYTRTGSKIVIVNEELGSIEYEIETLTKTTLKLTGNLGGVEVTGVFKRL